MSWGKEWPKPDNDSTFTIADVQRGKDWLDKNYDKYIDKAISNGYEINGVTNKVYSNKVPTHDPYSNPDSHIYYECACGAILDPGTKSFAALNNAASAQGWKVRWGAEHYKPYCIKCGHNVD